MMNDELTEKYLSLVKKNLLCSSKDKRIFLSELRKGLNDFVQENPESTYEDIVNVFGTPEAQANEFVNSLDTKAIKKAFSWKKAVIIFIIIALVAWGIGVAVSAGKSFHDRSGHGVESPVIIEENNVGE